MDSASSAKWHHYFKSFKVFINVLFSSDVPTVKRKQFSQFTWVVLFLITIPFSTSCLYRLLASYTFAKIKLASEGYIFETKVMLFNSAIKALRSFKISFI